MKYIKSYEIVDFVHYKMTTQPWTGSFFAKYWYHNVTGFLKFLQ